MNQNHWTKYRTEQINLSKSVYNNEVSELLSLHYKYLHSKLVNCKDDEGIFNDTYLKMTYRYNPQKDFIDQFIYHFNLYKGNYKRYDYSNRSKEISLDDCNHWGLV